MAEEEKSDSSGSGCGALVWLLLVTAAFYGAGWSVGTRVDLAAAYGVGNSAMQYQPPTAFIEQIKKYQIGVTADNGTEWYGVFATARFIDVGWWTWVPFFLLGFPIIVLIPMGSD